MIAVHSSCPRARGNGIYFHGRPQVSIDLAAAEAEICWNGEVRDGGRKAIFALLYRLERSHGLSPQDRQRVAQLPLTVANFAADQEVARYGDAPARCTLVLGGLLYSHKLASGSRRQITSFLVPGDRRSTYAASIEP